MGRGRGGEEETRERRRGEEERSLTQQTAPPPPFPSLPSQPAVLQLLVDIDPGGAVSGRAAWKVSALGAGEAPPPIPLFPSSRYLRLCGVLPCHNLGAAGTNAAAVTLITPPPPSPPPPATHTYAVLSLRSALKLADREGLGDS